MKTVKRSLPWRAAAATALCLGLVAPGARAANILIDAGNIEELVTFTFSQFEGGFSINGSTPTSGGSFTFGEGTLLNFTGQWLDLGLATAFTRTIYYVDPDDGLNVQSEVFQWTVTPSGPSGQATISGFFQAEGLGTIPPGVPQSDIIVECADGSHDPFQFSAPFLTGQLITGVGTAVGIGNCAGTVPEPTTGLLAGAGVLGLLFWRRSRAVLAKSEA